jgi:hypothetical protein
MLKVSKAAILLDAKVGKFVISDEWRYLSQHTVFHYQA